MAQDMQSLRRRAAQAVLSPVLGEAELEAALAFQQDVMRNDGITSIVAFIDKVGASAMLDAATCKRLYGEMYKALTGSPDSLPPDPWATRLAVSRAAVATGAPSPAPIAAPTPAPVPQAAPVAAPQPALEAAPVLVPEPAPVAAPAAPAVALNPSQAVFAALVGDVRNAVQQFYGASFSELRTDLQAIFKKAKYAPETVAAFFAVWDAPSPEGWQALDTEKTLAELVHFLYRGLCETLGPVDADQVLTRAVQEAEKAPEAATFPPARFL